MLLEFSSAGSSMRFAALTLLVAVMFELYPAPGWAVDYPTRSITLVVPSPPGGGTDTQARILAPKLSELLGQTIIIENRGGASGNIGAQAVAKAAPDGYTLLAMISSHVINPYVLKEVPYDIDRNFAMISRTVTAPGVLVGNPSLPAKNLHELIAYMKADSGKVSFQFGRRRQSVASDRRAVRAERRREAAACTRIVARGRRLTTFSPVRWPSWSPT